MRNILLLTVILVLVGLGIFAYIKQNLNTDTLAQGSAVIVLKDTGFEPREVTVLEGATVTFVNQTLNPFWPASNLHPTHQLYPEFDPLHPLGPEEEWSFTFNEAGTYNFHDHIRAYFVGTIHVVK